MEKPTVRNIYRVERDRCGDFEANRHLEWLVANGRGGFAMATVFQMLTRRYHGLLVAAVDPPVERFVLLAKLEATVAVGGREHELGTNQYADVVYPDGYKRLESFTARPHPTWRWRVGTAIIEQTLCLVEGEDTTVIRYRLLEAEGPIVLTVRPFCTSRHFHLLTRRQDLGEPEVAALGDTLAFRWPNNRPAWRLSHNGTFVARPDWNYGVFLNTEAERGYDTTQDLYVPGVIAATLRPSDLTGLVLTASTQDRSWKTWREAFAHAVALDEVHIKAGAVDDPLLLPLVRATRDFLVVRDRELKTVIAGYPWFGDWGRDTFISLPGLCLATGRFEDARRIIQAFAKHVSEGMIPNRFPDFGEAPAYNTIDATLWYIHAVDRYLAYTGDWTFIADKMFAVIGEILAAHEHGTRHGIRLCDDGLLAGGEPGLALTWMDAKLPDRAITPRIGKPVEINALWYNALLIAAAFAKRLGDARKAEHWQSLAERSRRAFNERFWNQSAGCLYDVADANNEPGGDDPAIRPNQLFAISLTHPVLDQRRWREVVGVCERELWTPLGMRTLSPTDPAYRRRYCGDLIHRDEAYHQGTVWPWLLGPFITAYVKAMGGSAGNRPAIRRASSGECAVAGPDEPEPTARSSYAELHPACRTARQFLDGLLAHLHEDGVGSVCEVADGDPPHTAGGCPWQAWSVAEPLRALCEDIYNTCPRNVRT